MTNKFKSLEVDKEEIDIDRRITLSRLGLVASAAYVAPALMTLDATLTFHGADGPRSVKIDDLWHPDGIYNKKVKGELLTEIRIPARAGASLTHHGAYGKLRERGSIDFPPASDR